MSTYFVSGRSCPDPPNPPAEHNMVLVEYGGHPVRIGEASLKTLLVLQSPSVLGCVNSPPVRNHTT